MAPTFKPGKLYIRHTLADLCHQPPHSINHSSRSFLATKASAAMKRPRQSANPSQSQAFRCSGGWEAGVGRMKNSWQDVPKGLWFGGREKRKLPSAYLQNVCVKETRAHWETNKQIYQSGCSFTKCNIEGFCLSLPNSEQTNQIHSGLNVSLLSGCRISRKGPFIFV